MDSGSFSAWTAKSQELHKTPPYDGTAFLFYAYELWKRFRRAQVNAPPIPKINHSTRSNLALHSCLMMVGALVRCMSASWLLPAVSLHALVLALVQGMLQYDSVYVEHDFLGQIGNMVTRPLQPEEHALEVKAESGSFRVPLYVLGQCGGGGGVDFVY